MPSPPWTRTARQEKPGVFAKLFGGDPKEAALADLANALCDILAFGNSLQTFSIKLAPSTHSSFVNVV